MWAFQRGRGRIGTSASVAKKNPWKFSSLVLCTHPIVQFTWNLHVYCPLKSVTFTKPTNVNRLSIKLAMLVVQSQVGTLKISSDWFFLLFELSVLILCSKNISQS